MNDFAETGGAAPCAAAAKASAAAKAATQIRRITSGKASAPRWLGRYLTRIFSSMWSAVGSTPGFRVISSSTVVPYLSAIEPSVSPLCTV